MALGTFAEATNFEALAVGSNAEAIGISSIAMGTSSSATNRLTIAIGGSSTATGIGATAVGNNAEANHDSSTAIGRDATTNANNQVTLGGAGSSVRIGDIDASTLAQTGPVNAVTVDANGTLGKGAVASASQLNDLRGATQRSLAMHDAQFNALQGQVNTLYDLASHDRKQMRQGVAAAMAMADAPFPSEPGKTSYAAKGSVFRGEVAFGASLSHRLDVGAPFALTASVSHSGGKNTGASVGFSGEF